MGKNELIHYGIMGMRWGSRRSGTISTSSPRKSLSTKFNENKIKGLQKDIDSLESARSAGGIKGLSKKELDDSIDALKSMQLQNKEKLSSSQAKDRNKQSTKQKSTREMSDDELRKVVNRLQMERQYSQLSGGSIGKGKQYAEKLIKAGTTVAAVTTTALTIYNNAGKIKAIFEKVSD